MYDVEYKLRGWRMYRRWVANLFRREKLSMWVKIECVVSFETAPLIPKPMTDERIAKFRSEYRQMVNKLGVKSEFISICGLDDDI